MKPLSLVAALSLSAFPAALLPAAALADEWEMAGHKVVLEEAPDGGLRMMADGQQVLESWQIFADQAVEVTGGAVILGTAGPGGNACNPSPFALWLPEGGEARLDGPVESCSYLVPVIDGDRVTWDSEPLPDAPAESFSWTSEGRIVVGEAESFAPVPGLGWEAVAMLADRHPAEALRIEPVYNDIRAALGDQFPEFAESISGLGSGGLVGKDYYGEACIKLVCETNFAGIWLDAAQKKVFAYMAVEGKEGIQLYPADRALWPAAALERLDQRGQ